MAKRDLNKTARNKAIEKIQEDLKILLPEHCLKLDMLENNR